MAFKMRSVTINMQCMLRAALKICSLYVGMQEGGYFEQTCRWAIGLWNKDMVNEAIGRAHDMTDDV